MRKLWWIPVVIAVPGVLVWLAWPSKYCPSARRQFGIEVKQCPDGKVRQLLRIDGQQLRRGGQGTVRIRATALYTAGQADAVQQARIAEPVARLTLVDARGKERALPLPTPTPKPGQMWRHHYAYSETTVALPAKLDDGDYKLRARVKTKVGEGTVDLPLAIYAPARIHVLTDRPLYEAGNRIRFRALVVRARDLSPIDNRPGTWLIKDPAGNVLLEEKAPAGKWGVAAGDFLLDSQAQTGRWSITWRSSVRTPRSRRCISRSLRPPKDPTGSSQASTTRALVNRMRPCVSLGPPRAKRLEPVRGAPPPRWWPRCPTRHLHQPFKSSKPER